MSLKQNSPTNLPSDLILEILSRLPPKSIARCRCLSKLWASLLTLNSPYFTELFLTQSKTRPRLLFAFERKEDNKWSLYSCPQPQISYKTSKSSFSVTAEFHKSFSNIRMLHMSPPVSGLMYFHNVLCNPSTGHIFQLPHLKKMGHSFLGYDPINKQFNVLAVSYSARPYRINQSVYQILNLEFGRLFWRDLNCPLQHYASLNNICINGILYYNGAFELGHESYDLYKIVCFDLNSEEFNFVDLPFNRRFHNLVNFKGKLGGINKKWVEIDKKRYNLELSLWVLEDIKKQEWSKHEIVLPSSFWTTKPSDFFVLGVTATSELVLSLSHITNPLYVYFFNLEKNILQKVQVKGLERFKRFKCRSFNGCVNYTEDLNVLKWR